MQVGSWISHLPTFCRVFFANWVWSPEIKVGRGGWLGEGKVLPCAPTSKTRVDFEAIIVSCCPANSGGLPTPRSHVHGSLLACRMPAGVSAAVRLPPALFPRRPAGASRLPHPPPPPAGCPPAAGGATWRPLLFARESASRAAGEEGRRAAAEPERPMTEEPRRLPGGSGGRPAPGGGGGGGGRAGWR